MLVSAPLAFQNFTFTTHTALDALLPLHCPRRSLAALPCSLARDPMPRRELAKICLCFGK